jgi:peptidoglycan-associated lipoprotein
MTNQWLRSFAVIVLAGLVMAGCSSKGSKAEPATDAGAGAGYETQGSSTGGAGAQGYGFDSEGNPFMPGTNQPLERVFYFEFDDTQIKQSDLTALEMHADILRNNPERAIVIEGHADERGTREYNLALGERRANAIRSFLAAAGVSSTQMETVSYGEERPVDPGHSEDAWARNRRAVLVYR